MPSPPAIPPATPEQQRELAQREERHREGKFLERRRHLRTLLFVSVLVIAFSVAHAGFGRVFPHGWWRVW